MPKVKVRTLRPLNGEPEGQVKSYDKVDAERLAETGAVKILGPDKSDSLKPKRVETAAKAKKPSAAARRKAVGKAPANKSLGNAPANKAR